MEKGLKINVNSLATDPVMIAADLDPRVFDLGAESRLLEPVHVRAKVHRLGEKVYIRGQVETAVELQCSRCLQTLSQLVRSPLTLLAVRVNQVVEVVDHDDTTGSEKADLDDALTIAYTGDQVDLNPEIESLLTLALPMKPLCSETCQGLCPGCGARLSDGPCSCEGEADGQNGPFSALRQWRS